MAIRYSVVKRKNLGKDKVSYPQKYYAQGLNVAQIPFETVCEEAAEASAMTTADMKAAVDRESLPEDGLQREDWRVGLHPHGDRLDGIGHGGGVQRVVDQGAEGGVSPGPDVDAGKEERVVRAGQEWRDGAVGA